MEWGTVSFIFCIIFTGQKEQQGLIIEEEYCLFEFANKEDLQHKIDKRSQLLQKINNRAIIYNGQSGVRKFLGTRNFYSLFSMSDKEGDRPVDFTELAYSVFYAETLENAKRVAEGKDSDISYDY